MEPQNTPYSSPSNVQMLPNLEKNLMWLNPGSWDEEIVLGYLCEP